MEVIELGSGGICTDCRKRLIRLNDNMINPDQRLNWCMGCAADRGFLKEGDYDLGFDEFCRTVEQSF